MLAILVRVAEKCEAISASGTDMDAVLQRLVAPQHRLVVRQHRYVANLRQHVVLQHRAAVILAMSEERVAAAMAVACMPAEPIVMLAAIRIPAAIQQASAG